MAEKPSVETTLPALFQRPDSASQAPPKRIARSAFTPTQSLLKNGQSHFVSVRQDKLHAPSGPSHLRSNSPVHTPTSSQTSSPVIDSQKYSLNRPKGFFTEIASPRVASAKMVKELADSRPSTPSRAQGTPMAFSALDEDEYSFGGYFGFTSMNSRYAFILRGFLVFLMQ
jgi:hypothetical protein